MSHPARIIPTTEASRIGRSVCSQLFCLAAAEFGIGLTRPARTADKIREIRRHQIVLEPLVTAEVDEDFATEED